MLRSFLSEWVKLRRTGMLLGGAVIVGFAALTTVLTLVTASNPTGERGPVRQGLTLAQLAAPDGFARTMTRASTFIGVVALVLFAIAVAGEYSQGTLRNLVVRQPRRLRLLAGKLPALAGFTAITLLAAEVAAGATALAVAPSQDLPTSSWFTSAGWTALGTAFANLLLATWGWGLLGALLALLLRSPAAAVGVGVAYALPFELLLTAGWDSGERWLPGQLLGALAEGGTTTVTYTRVAVVLAVYGVLAATAGSILFARRDITA
jgi:ABC-2 type transport system permease protein